MREFLTDKECDLILGDHIRCTEFRFNGFLKEDYRAVKRYLASGGRLLRLKDTRTGPGGYSEFLDKLPWAPGCEPAADPTPEPAPEPRAHKYAVGDKLWWDGKSKSGHQVSTPQPATAEPYPRCSHFGDGEPCYRLVAGWVVPESSLRPAPKFAEGDWVVTSNNTLVKVTGREWQGDLLGWRYDGNLTRGYHRAMNEANLRPLAEVTQ